MCNLVQVVGRLINGLTSCAGSYETLLGAVTGGRGGRGGRGRKKGGKQQRRADPFYYIGQGMYVCEVKSKPHSGGRGVCVYVRTYVTEATAYSV